MSLPHVSMSHSVFTRPGRMTAILISRFLIRLQTANRTSCQETLSESVDTIVFQRVVGSIGASIGPKHFGASSEHADELWDEEASTDMVQEEVELQGRTTEHEESA